MNATFFIPRGIAVSRVLILTAVLALVGCGTGHPPMSPEPPEHNYLIGPGDNVNIFVWRQPELSATVPVRPDGKITTPLVEDVPASGKTPTRLARDMERALKKYIRDPIVTVIVTGFVGPYSQQIRVVGQAVNPQTIPYREDMTVLDVMIEVGGLTEFAAGNRASIVREIDGETKQFGVHLDDLIKQGEIDANVPVRPGDTLIIPESWF
ncbi:MAG: XrtA/PEP-CTERM system exopolysaccharide export protein [Thiohalophilus sp.]|nr:XrtA/PEP-CTERM system exopolysaccharide export protein [Thiohalophilus sp.]MDZ7803458.1 XrtA/PEP-CTERM system exopolysaccharide export protein [Thiohalophilus sp.]